MAFVILISLPFLRSCDHRRSSPTVVRYGFVTGLKPEKLAYYKLLHENAWPKVLDRISKSNIRNYSIYLQQIGTEYYLFSYFEYGGENFDADMKKMAEDPVTQKWWKETAPCQLPLGKDGIWTTMEEVFHTD